MRLTLGLAIAVTAACLTIMALAASGPVADADPQSQPFGFSSFPPTNATVGEDYVYELNFTQRPVTKALQQCPDGMVLHGAYVTWTPREGQEGTHMVVLTASDGAGNNVTQIFHVRVSRSKDLPPDIVILKPGSGTRFSRSETVQVWGIVGSPLPEAELSMRLDDGKWEFSIVPGAGDWYMNLTDMDPGTHLFTVRAWPVGGGAPNETSISFEVFEEPINMNTVVTVSSPIIIVISSLVIIAMTDAGKYKLTASLVVPLYTKISKDRVLDRFTRGKVYQYIRDNPGEIYTAIMESLELSNGALSYHLKVLEREGLVYSMTNGTFRHFFPKYMAPPRYVFRLSRIQQVMINHVKKNPGISPNTLAGELQVTSGAVTYHLKHLLVAGILRTEKNGIGKRCYLVGEGRTGKD